MKNILHILYKIMDFCILKNSAFYLLIFVLSTLSLNFNAQDVKSKNPILVTKIINGKSGDSVTFKYDGNKLIETEDSELKSIYSYTSNLITQIKDYKSNDLIKTADFTYYKNGTLMAIKVEGIKENYGPYTEDYSFKYPTPSSIVCTEFELYDNYEDKKPHKMSTVYTLNKGNKILQKDASYEGKSVELEILKSYVYDNSNNPYLNILGYDKIMVYISEAYDEFATGKNNMTSYKLYQNKKPADHGSTAKFMITYNANNFPEKIVSKYYNKDGILYDNITYTYTYNQ